MVGAFADFEREMIRVRMKTGLGIASLEGRISGDRPNLRENQWQILQIIFSLEE